MDGITPIHIITTTTTIIIIIIITIIIPVLPTVLTGGRCATGRYSGMLAAMMSGVNSSPMYSSKAGYRMSRL